MVGDRYERMPRTNVKREILWSGVAELQPTRFKQKYPRNGDELRGFVRVHLADWHEVSQVPVYLHDETSGAVRRVLRSAKKQKLPFLVEVARNSYDAGEQQMTIDLHEAMAGTRTTHRVHLVKQSEASKMDAVLVDAVLALGEHEVFFFAEPIRKLF